MGRGRTSGAPRGRRRTRGQSLVEFALVLPVMLALLGGSLDLARLYHTWIALESATRDAAEYAASDPNVGSPPQGSTSIGEATADAQGVICAQFGQDSSCTDPTVTLPTALPQPPGASAPARSNPYISTTASDGAVPGYPVVTVAVSASTNFRTLFPYPFISQQTLTLRSTRTFSIMQSRTNEEEP